MSFEADEEILQDFLIEAGEILESLSEQLVELENDPDNAELLNSIFRGFHTVKGGAGFLALNHLVDVCHGAENIFDLLRTGQRAITSSLMDVILQALDALLVMDLALICEFIAILFFIIRFVFPFKIRVTLVHCCSVILSSRSSSISFPSNRIFTIL